MNEIESITKSLENTLQKSGDEIAGANTSLKSYHKKVKDAVSTSKESKKLSYKNMKSFSCDICRLAAKGMTQLGPYNNEALYQQKLVKDLGDRNIRSRSETVFAPSCINSHTGEREYYGGHQSFRTDVEFETPSLKGGFLELKSTNAKIKPQHKFQCINYLNQRPDLNWGIVVNYVSDLKSGSWVETILFMKSDNTIMFENGVEINTFLGPYEFSIKSYPGESDFTTESLGEVSDEED